MAATSEIQVSVEEEAKTSRISHLERKPIENLENKKTSDYHQSLGLTQNAIQTMINSLKGNEPSIKFEIGWKPEEKNSTLFNTLKSSRNALTITLYWFIRDSGTLVYSRNAVIKGGKVSKPAESKGTAPNAIQYVEFTASSIEPSK